MTLEDTFSEYLSGHEKKKTCRIPHNYEYHVPQERKLIINEITKSVNELWTLRDRREYVMFAFPQRFLTKKKIVSLRLRVATDIAQLLEHRKEREVE